MKGNNGGKKDTSGIEIADKKLIPVFKQDTSENKEIWNEIDDLMKVFFKNAGVNYLKRTVVWWYFSKLMVNGAKNGEPLLDIESKLRSFVRKRFPREESRIPQLRKRAQRSFSKIKDWLVGDKILDLGAGNGFLGELIHNELKKEVKLMDVIDYNFSSLPIDIIKPGSKLPLEDNEVNTTLLYAVLHHAEDPDQVLREAVRVTKNRIVLVEGYVENPKVTSINSYFDWFLNRVAVDTDMNVPFNYRKQSEWEADFQKLGLELVKAEYWGMEDPIVPEHHILYVVDKIKPLSRGDLTLCD
jgi:SAM-dependent methyltransferase